MSDGPSFGWQPPQRGRAAPPPPPPPPPPPSGFPPDGPDPLAAMAAGPEASDPVARRLPVVALILVFVIAAVLVERGSDEPAPVIPVVAEASTGASAAGEGDNDAIWFCAAGTALGSTEVPAGERPPTPADVVAEHRLLITNAADAPRRVHVTAYPSVEVPTPGSPPVAPPAPVRRDFEVGAASRRDVDLADVLKGTTKAPFVSAMVEVDGSRVAVAHRLRGPAGESTAPCASRTSRSWYFAAGSTDSNTRQLLVLFNPFPQQVVADIVFQAEDGDRQALRAPQRLEGVVVPPERTLAIDVTNDVADRRQLSTRIEAKEPTARLVADRLVFNPGAPATGELPFLSVGPGAPTARSGWVFSDGRPLRKELTTTFVLYNPSGEPVDVEMRVRPDRVQTTEPFRVTVRTGQYQQITLDESRIGADAGYWAALVARSGGTFVVERVVQAKPQAPPAPPPGAPSPSPSVGHAGGTTYNLGTPVLGTEWIVPAAAVDGGAGLTAITNLGDSVVTLQVETLVEGQVVAVKDFDGVTLDPGLRTTVDLADPALSGAAAGTRRSLRVRANGPIAVETTLAPGAPAEARGVADLMAVPVRGNLSLPFAEVLSRASPDPVVPTDPAAGAGTVPAPPGTATPGTR
jgi:hypothetical protein